MLPILQTIVADIVGLIWTFRNISELAGTAAFSINLRFGWLSFSSD